MRRDPGPTSAVLAMQCGVLLPAHDLKVLNPVVGAIPVDVEHNVVESQRTDNDQLLGNPSVFRHPSTTGKFHENVAARGLNVRAVVVSASSRSVADQGTIAPQLSASSLREGLSTDLTDARLGSRALRRLGAGMRTVAVRTGAALSAGLGKGRAALFAGKLEGHRVLLTLVAKPSVGSTAGGLSFAQFYNTGA